ncbi:hypothetical protein H7142_03050 [Candidatus Saccharibacteria bacterium]|nr:hypothetical protein [Candidatus Saccharibacteria bacterium]
MARTKGFALVEGLMLVGVVLLLVGVGYVGWKAFTQSGAPQASLTSSDQSAQVITTKADLDAAEKALDELSFEDSDTAEAETQASL